MATYLSRTPGSAGNRKIFTISLWFKRSEVGDRNCLFSTDGSNDHDRFELTIHQNNYLMVGLNSFNVFETDMLFRDISAWYHIMFVADTTQGSSSNRTKLYVNGSQVTDFSATNQNSISSNFDFGVNNTNAHKIGASPSNGDGTNGYMADFNLIDGSALTPSSFGETDSTTGIWKPKSISGVTYGTNGVYLQFKNSGALGTDTSGNSNTYAVNNAGTNAQVVDTPSNVFCTLNPLATGSRGTFSLGNTKVQLNLQGSVPYGQVEFGTYAVNSGKWYFEVKNISAGGGGKMGLGINERWETNTYVNGHNNVGSSGNAFYSNQGDIKVGTGSDQSASSYTDNDIISVAFDLTNSKVYFAKNGVWQRSGDPANGTGGDTLTSSYNDYWTPWITKDSDNASHNPTVEFNFGNPAFSISSGNTDANGFGNFEYAVPSGFYALCTKNINSYG